MAKYNPLAEFPPNFNYPTAAREEHDRFDALLGRLLAAENVGTLESTERIDEAINTARANVCRMWLDKVREQLRRMRAAQLYCEENPAAALAEDAAKASAWYDRAAEKLRKAQAEMTEAGAAKSQATLRQKMRAEADELLAPQDLVVVAAWSELQVLLKK